MSANVGSVFFSLRAGATDLAKDIDRAMGVANKKLIAAGKVIGRGLTVALATSTAAITAATVKGVNSIDQLAKESDKLGVPIGQLQLLRHAADLTGVASNQLGTGLQRMTRRVSEAAKGTGEAKDALKELRLNAQQLAKLSPDQQFLAVSKAMQGVANQGDRVRLAMKLFDSEGVGLVNTLRLTEGELGKMKSELTALGVIIDRDAAAKVERAKDAFTVFSRVFTGFSNSLAIELAPLLTMVGDELVRLSLNTGGFRSQIQSAIGAAVLGFGQVRDILHGVNLTSVTAQRGFAAIGQFSVVAADMAVRAWKNMQEAFTVVVASIKLAFAKGLAEMSDLLIRTTIKFSELQNNLPFINIDVDRLKGQLGQAQEQFNLFLDMNRTAFKKALTDFKEPTTTGLEDSVIQAVERVEELDAKLQKLKEAPLVADRLKAKFDDYVVSLDEAVTKTQELSRASVDLGQTAGNAIDDIDDKADDAADNISKAAAVATENWQAFAWNVSSAIDQFVETGRFKIDAFVRDVLQDLAKIQLRNLLLGEDGVGGILGGIAGSLKLPITTTPGAAMGAHVTAGEPRIIGERGVELFKPDVSGTIIPHNPTQGILSSSGGAPVNITQNYSGGMSRQEVGALVQQANEALVRAIVESKKDGGGFGAAFA